VLDATSSFAKALEDTKNWEGLHFSWRDFRNENSGSGCLGGPSPTDFSIQDDQTKSNLFPKIRSKIKSIFFGQPTLRNRSDF